jgi:hypothetical protein
MSEKREVKLNSDGSLINLNKCIQNFLTKYKKGSDQKFFSFRFSTNPDLYIPEAQLPDLWLKTRKQFNKNECFVFTNSEEEKKMKENMFPK